MQYADCTIVISIWTVSESQRYSKELARRSISSYDLVSSIKKTKTKPKHKKNVYIADGSLLGKHLLQSKECKQYVFLNLGESRKAYNEHKKFNNGNTDRFISPKTNTSSKCQMVDWRDTVQLAAVGTLAYQHQVS